MLITPEYVAQNKGLYAKNALYGTSGGSCAHLARPAADWGRTPILDYGAGRQILAKALGPAYSVTPYDPCVDGIDTPPEPCAVVVCSDVLEHVEPECLDAVLSDLRRVTLQRAVLLVHMGPALKHLPDGRNAHLIQQDAKWWADRIKGAGFDIVKQGDGLGPAGEVLGVWFEAVPI